MITHTKHHWRSLCSIIVALAFIGPALFGIRPAQAQTCSDQVGGFDFDVTSSGNSVTYTSETVGPSPCNAVGFIIKLGNVADEDIGNPSSVDIQLLEVSGGSTVNQREFDTCPGDGDGPSTTSGGKNWSDESGDNCGAHYQVATGNKLKVKITDTECDGLSNCGTAYVEMTDTEIDWN